VCSGGERERESVLYCCVTAAVGRGGQRRPYMGVPWQPPQNSTQNNIFIHWGPEEVEPRPCRCFDVVSLILIQKRTPAAPHITQYAAQYCVCGTNLSLYLFIWTYLNPIHLWQWLEVALLGPSDDWDTSIYCNKPFIGKLVVLVWKF